MCIYTLGARPVGGDEDPRASSDASPWWSRQLGPRTIGTPSISDLDGDGTPEIVVCSYDGRVYALGGPRAGQMGDDPAVWEPGSAAPSDGDCVQFRAPGCGAE